MKSVEASTEASVSSPFGESANEPVSHRRLVVAREGWATGPTRRPYQAEVIFWRKYLVELTLGSASQLVLAR